MKPIKFLRVDSAIWLAAILFLLHAPMAADAAQRDYKVVREFKREVPCPANNKRRGHCPGFQVDHIIPLCAGGLDHPSNLQWLTIYGHRHKTRDDVKTCAALRRERKNRSIN